MRTPAGLPRQNAGKYNAMTAKRTVRKGTTNASVQKPLKVPERKIEKNKIDKDRIS